MRRINHIFTVLAIAVLLILLTAFIKVVRENIFYLLIAALVAYWIIFWRKKQREDLYLTSFLLLAFLIARMVFRNIDQPTLVLRTAAILSFLLLSIVLLIGPWSRFSDRVMKRYHFRRHLGVTTFLLGSMHPAIIIPQYFNYSIQNALQSIFVFYGLSAFFLLFWLAITSWDYLQKKVKPIWWKILHAALLILYLGIVYSVYNIQKTIEPALNYHLIAIGVFVLVWIIISPYSIINKIMKTYVFGWKQLHVLIYVIYFSLILHILLGALTTQGVVVKSIFYASIAFVLGSHVAGWIKRWLEDRKIYSRINAINQNFTEKGKEFIGVARVDELHEGKGKKVYIAKEPVAVFKSVDGFVALSNVCRHQKGPIYKGKLEYGNVECPWHYWTYNVKDGCSLGKDKYCLPVYETKVKDGILFVSSEPISKS